MDIAAQYCPTRKGLEERGWSLTSQLSTLSSRLLTLVAVDHRGFNATTAKCLEVRSKLKESHRELKEHRSEHGC
jgi:hypothetical protein